MLNKYKILVITKRHSGWIGNKHPTVSLQGRRQTIKIKQKSQKDNTLNLFNAGTKNPAYLTKTEVSLHSTTTLIFKMPAWRYWKRLNYIQCILFKKAGKCFIQANLFRPRGSSIWQTPSRTMRVAFSKKKKKKALKAYYVPVVQSNWLSSL